MKITRITGREILSSRGEWTLEVTVYAGKYFGTASDPSGKSVGSGEVVSIVDADGQMMHALQRVAFLDTKLRGYAVEDQETLDLAMLTLDGTPDKSRLGGNVLLAVSLAAARCAAAVKGKELFDYLKRGNELPIPFSNMINGGLHANNGLKVQEFLVVPHKVTSFSEALLILQRIYMHLGEVLTKKYGSAATLVGDEGGFAPVAKKTTNVLDVLVEVLDDLSLSKKVGLALDVAASTFYKKNKYYFERKVTSDQLHKYYDYLLRHYPLLSLEDPFAETDIAAWKKFKPPIQVVGDDVLVTHLEKVHRAWEEKWCTAVLVKPNQVGTLTETLAVMQFAQKKGMKVMVSNRSGETNDTFIADLAIGAGQAKLGAPCRGERVAKYNRLLAIESLLGKKATYAKL